MVSLSTFDLSATELSTEREREREKERERERDRERQRQRHRERERQRQTDRDRCTERMQSIMYALTPTLNMQILCETGNDKYNVSTFTPFSYNKTLNNQDIIKHKQKVGRIIRWYGDICSHCKMCGEDDGM